MLFVRAPDGLALDDDGDRAELHRLVTEHDPAVVLLDPFYKAHRGDPNDERVIVDVMRYLDALRELHGFALLLLVHPRKDPASRCTRKLRLDDGVGSGTTALAHRLAHRPRNPCKRSIPRGLEDR